MKSLITYLDCGGWQPEEAKNLGQFVVSRFSDISDKIIPLFNKYPIAGVKSLDFADFCKVAELMKEKAHLTEEGLAEIRLIKAGMNSGRASLLISQTSLRARAPPFLYTCSPPLFHSLIYSLYIHMYIYVYIVIYICKHINNDRINYNLWKRGEEYLFIRNYLDVYISK